MAKPIVPVAVSGSNAVISYEDELKKLAIATAQVEKPSSNWLSFKSGVLSYAGQPAPNNKVEVVVLDSIFENAYYEGRFNPNDPSPPTCFAFAEKDEELAPHESVESPQNTQCAGCKWNEWKSDPDGGKGKACKNSRRIAVMTANDLVNVDKADVALARIPVTSVKNWSTYANQIANTLKIPPLGVVTELSVAPHPTSQFQVNFRFVRKIEDGEQLQALLRKRGAVNSLINMPYDKPQPKGATPERKY